MFKTFSAQGNLLTIRVAISGKMIRKKSDTYLQQKRQHTY